MTTSHYSSMPWAATDCYEVAHVHPGGQPCECPCHDREPGGYDGPPEGDDDLVSHVLVDGVLYRRCHKCRRRPVPHAAFILLCDPCLDDATEKAGGLAR